MTIDVSNSVFMFGTRFMSVSAEPLTVARGMLGRRDEVRIPCPDQRTNDQVDAADSSL